MAWITKNSATEKIARRPEPYLDDELKAKLESEVLTRYPTRQAATLPVLHAMQHRVGWLPKQVIEEVADFLELESSTVLDTATFYEEFWLEPKGKYVFWVCQSISCEIMGEPGLTEKLEAKLGIGVGETTEDGKFTLMKVECLGSCGTAPCALVNEVLHENLTPENLDAIVDSLD
ncbi:NADH-quinone oxidoreductase subunit NuoE [Mucisphaera sp.]|uniref:NADH-quinone oxidoreductase subunit NuoE n=1 Tax=Mucisphaera sp. TaxID=2913024 RepID=UPI003D0B660B